MRNDYYVYVYVRLDNNSIGKPLIVVLQLGFSNCEGVLVSYKQSLINLATPVLFACEDSTYTLLLSPIFIGY